MLSLVMFHYVWLQMKPLRMSRNKHEDIKQGSMCYACTSSRNQSLVKDLTVGTQKMVL